MSVTDVVTTVGWIGAAAGAAAYLLVTRGRWNASSARYQTANLTGAGLMGGVAAFNGIWPAFAANLVWVVIGAQALWMIVVKRREDRLVVATADHLRLQWADEAAVPEDDAAAGAEPVPADEGAPALAVAELAVAELAVADQQAAADEAVWQSLLGSEADMPGEVAAEANPTLRMSIDELAELQVRRRRRSVAA
ncbi:hypothetical protein CLV56_3113 [Mumia flava]|uniref:CBU-0592-like domain-containing protein n=1 Tax=Mumia flava TaxID=1348852 RepID=A0A2M9B6P8_9ACTN|nr:hypothetical protein [Mumia flava]PJJ53623.1 hypothetical protein CLV56_3113 [Mumia flava]